MTRTIYADSPPPGLHYVSDFVTTAEEQTVIDRLSAVEFQPVVIRNVAAKRTTAHYGWLYGYESWRITPAEPIPDWLGELRLRSAARADVAPEELEEALLSKYPEGAGIGWHRDAPMFGDLVIGISLGAACVMKFRKKEGGGYIVWKQRLESRSMYIIRSEARRVWQHSIASTPSLRYSITFRTLRERSGEVSRSIR